jgi:hypothetical protein
LEAIKYPNMYFMDLFELEYLFRRSTNSNDYFLVSYQLYRRKSSIDSKLYFRWVRWRRRRR